MLSAYALDKGSIELVTALGPGQIASGFRENTTYGIQREDDCLNFYIDDEALVASSDGRFWIWSPGFYAGRVFAEAQLRGHRQPTKYVLEVSPSSSKQTEDLFRGYIQDIAEYSPSMLLGIEPATLGIGGKSETSDLWLAFRRIRMYGDLYLRALRRIAEHPSRTLVQARRAVTPVTARAVDRQSLISLMRQPKVSAAMLGLESPSSSKIDEFSRARMDVPFSEATFDNDANRTICAQARSVLRLITRVIGEFESIKPRASQTETDLALRLPRRLEELRRLKRRIQHGLQLPPLDSVSQKPAGAAGLNAIGGNPSYGACYEWGARMLRKGISGLSEDEFHHICTTWQVYENWCYCVIADALKERFPTISWRESTSEAGSDRRLAGRSAEIQIGLYFQARCPTLKQSSDSELLSISRERRPDIVLVVGLPGKEFYFCLDAKYMAARQNLLEAMASAHIYHDAIRRKEIRPEAAFLLVPEAAAVNEFCTPNYSLKHRVGIRALQEKSQARKLVAELLGPIGNNLFPGQLDA